MKILVGLLITFVICLIITYILPEPNSVKYFKQKLKEDDKRKKDNEEIEKRLHNEEKYDSNYHKRHS